MEDVEAYLEAQVEAAAKAQSESEKKTEGSNGAGNGDDGRSRDRKDRDKDRDKDRERGRDSGRDRDRKRSRSRSRDRDRKRRSKSRSRSRERRSRRSRSRDRKAKSLSPIKDERTKEQKELDELTKDQRTVFVSQLVMKANEKDLQRFFGNFGKVRSVVMIRDKATNRHKGFAYVEMADLEIIPSVLLMNNQVPDFQKFPIAVAASRAERNYLAKQEAKTGVKTTSTGPGDRGPVANRVFLGNLHPNITEHDIRELLSPFGTVTQISLQTNEHGLSRGYAFASFSRPEEAQAVMAQLGGVMLADRPLRVGPATESGSASARASGNWRLDDDEGSGMHMNAQGRVALMAKLGHTAGMQIQAPVMPVLPPIGGGVGMPYPSVGSAGPPPMNGLPSPAILVRNMFDPATETEEGWADDIRLDVEEECSKHGRVLHIHVETQLPGGLVYLFFADLPSATKSATALHGRWFAGRMITVDYLQPEAYLAKFPEAARG